MAIVPFAGTGGRTVMDWPGNSALPDHSPTGDRGSHDTRLLQRVCGRPHPFPPDIPVLFRFRSRVFAFCSDCIRESEGKVVQPGPLRAFRYQFSRGGLRG